MAARFDATKFNWLGTPSIAVAAGVLWHTVPVNTVDDLRTKETTMGASGAQSGQAFVQFGSQPLKELPGVPFATDLATNADDKLLMEAAAARQALGRPLLLPPGVPADRVAAMRKALTDTFADPAFTADAEKSRMEINAPQSGQEVQDLIVRVSATPARVIERLQQLSGEAK